MLRVDSGARRAYRPSKVVIPASFRWIVGASLMTHGQVYSILITDDDPAARETLREIVAPQGYHTLMAESGEEALDLIRDHEVHLALMDMHLPRLSGLETLALVRQIKGGIPAILITADQDDNLMRRALSEPDS